MIRSPLLLVAFSALGCAGIASAFHAGTGGTSSAPAPAPTEQTATTPDYSSMSSQQISEDMQEKARRAAAANKATHDQQVAEAMASMKQHNDIEAWRRHYLATCSAALNYSICDASPTGTPKELPGRCKKECHTAFGTLLEAKVTDSLNACVAAATGPADCDLSLPADANPMENDSAKFADVWQTTKASCSTECVKQRADNVATAGDRKRAAEQADQIVLSYKRCMLAVDSTSQAVRYRLYDRDLYDNLMQATNDKCRSANRCDWLEKYNADAACAYGER